MVSKDLSIDLQGYRRLSTDAVRHANMLSNNTMQNNSISNNSRVDHYILKIEHRTRLILPLLLLLLLLLKLLLLLLLLLFMWLNLGSQRYKFQ